MFYGLLDLPWWGYVAFTFIATQITIASVTVYLHRCQAHRALEVHPGLGHLFRAWLWLTTGMTTRAWAAIHRKHHAHCETEEDPHSPQVMGLKTVLWEGSELYRLEAKNQDTMTRYGAGTPDDWLERNLYTPHSAKGLLLCLTTYICLMGIPGIIVWAIQMAWIPFFAAGVINGIGHYFGYRNFECPDASTNISPFGIFIGGEELHNNHHTYPTSAKLSVKWWEFDIGWGYIKLLSWLGLAKVKRVVPKAVSLPGKSSVDVDTLKALLSNRFQVMAQYSKNVLNPMFEQAHKMSTPIERNLLQHIKTALTREESLVDAESKVELEQALANNKSLELVYRFRKQLQAIWDKTSASQKELLEALQEWCTQAEATGVQYLKEFAAYIRGYTLRMA